MNEKTAYFFNDLIEKNVSNFAVYIIKFIWFNNLIKRIWLESVAIFDRLIGLTYSQGKSTLKLNSSAYEKYEYRHLGHWYIKLTLFKRF